MSFSSTFAARLSSYRERPGLGRGAALAGTIALVSCTLTQEEFQPARAAGALNPVDAGSPAASGAPSAAEAPDAAALPECRVAAECGAGAQCVSGICVANECAAAEDISACEIDLCPEGECSCSDGERGEGETDIDCGGGCGPCELGAACVRSADCVNASCVAGRCVDPTCDDGIQNQSETGTDCGGTSCEPCPSGQGCNTDGDCAAGLFCAPEARVCSPVSCQDGALNGSELAVDCGGGVCPGCPAASPCNTGDDCQSRSCSENVCVEATCTDGILNQDEADVDCGGSCLTPCDAGQACRDPLDCGSGVCGGAGCEEGVAACCQPASCTDGVQNGGEPSVDCGNLACGACRAGAPCAAGNQCESAVCTAGSCGPLVCGDGQRNGLEGAVDCGGPEPGCPRCADRQTCRVDSDCQSGDCAGGVCVSCFDGIQNGGEGGVDCGSGAPGCPACPRCTESNSIDMSTTGVVTTFAANACGKITQFPAYAPALIQSFDGGPFPFAFSWSQACSGQSGSSSFDSPYHQRQLPGLTTDCPIIFDFQGSAAQFGVRWF